MRKKALLEQNISLSKQIESLRAENAANAEKIKELEKTVEDLKQEAERAKAPATQPLKKLEEKVVSNARLDPLTEHASEVIGKLVVESAAGSNLLTAGGKTENRELVNLLLGKTEVAKAEILAIVIAEGDFEEKKAKIDAVSSETFDYFSSILAQIN